MTDTAARDRLVDELQPLVDAPADAERLACLLVGRRRFAAIVGQPPDGRLASLPSPFDSITIPERASALVDQWVRTADTGRLGAADIGASYGTALGPDARSERGQFFTPMPVAMALVRWVLDDITARSPRILDPAVGTGSFLLAAHRELSRRGRTVELDRLVGVDVDPAAIHVAGLRLAAASGLSEADGLELQTGSFFDYEPSNASSVSPGRTELGSVDAVVGNPPFVRAEALEPDMGHFRRHLDAFGPAGESPLTEGEDALSRRSDAYVYFVTHATRFLKPGGRLALVLPTKWLITEYGEGLRAFLRDRYRVHAVVNFGARPFGDALVETVLLLAVRDDDAPANETIRFQTIERSTDLEAGAIESEAPATTRTQAALTDTGSLARYLEAPDALLSLLDDAPFVRLDSLGRVARGTMTGANRFFFADSDTIERFGIAPQFLRPAVKSLRTIERPNYVDPDTHLIDVHRYVAEVRSKLAEGQALEIGVRAALATDGYDGLLDYIDHAESAGWHDGRTCQSRAVWFDLGPLTAPAAFVPKLLRQRVFTVSNAAGAVPSNAIDGVWPNDEVESETLLAVLNASVGAAAMEVTGRDEAGLLQLMTYETASLPTLDVRDCHPDDRRALATAGERFAESPTPDARASLDAAVDAAFDLALAPAQIREHVRGLRRRRMTDADPAPVAGD